MLPLIAVLVLTVGGRPPPEGVVEPNGNSKLPTGKAYQTMRDRAWSVVDRLKLTDPADVRCAWAMAALGAVKALEIVTWSNFRGQQKTHGTYAEFTSPEGKQAKTFNSSLGDAQLHLEDQVRQHCGPPGSPRGKRIGSAIFAIIAEDVKRRESDHRALFDMAQRNEPEKLVDGKPYRPNLVEMVLVVGGFAVPFLLPYLTDVVTAAEMSMAVKLIAQ